MHLIALCPDMVILFGSKGLYTSSLRGEDLDMILSFDAKNPTPPLRCVE